MFLNVHFRDFGLSCLPILERLFLPVLTDSDEWGRENVTDNSAPRFSCDSQITPITLKPSVSLSGVDELRSLGEENVFDMHVVLYAPKLACILLK